MSMQFVTGIYF